VTFSDLDELVGLNIAKCLARLAGWPLDRQLRDCSGLGEANRLDQAVAAETAVGADRSVNGACGAVSLFEVGADLGPECRSVGPSADQLHLEPVTVMAGVLKERTVAPVTGITAP